MLQTVLIRLEITIGLGLLGLALTLWSRHIQLEQARGNTNLLAGLLHPARRAIVCFTSPDCLPCRVIHKPALIQLLEDRRDKIDLIEINVYENPELARAWGVMSVPTTFVLDEKGRPELSIAGAQTYEQLITRLKTMKELIV